VILRLITFFFWEFLTRPGDVIDFFAVFISFVAQAITMFFTGNNSPLLKVATGISFAVGIRLWRLILLLILARRGKLMSTVYVSASREGFVEVPDPEAHPSTRQNLITEQQRDEWVQFCLKQQEEKLHSVWKKKRKRIK